MKKKNNNLVCIQYADGEKRYYTTSSRAGKHLGLHATSVSWAILNKNVLTDNAGRNLVISIIDGSEIPYKYINNN